MKNAFLFAALVLSACCTRSASISFISFQLSQEAAEQLVAAPVMLKTCFNGACWDTAFDVNDTSQGFDKPSFDESSRVFTQRQLATPGDSADVTFTASRDGGTLFTHEWSNVKFDHVLPNGALCGGDGYGLKDGPLKF
jgi:hypothetical protein